jgi:hypothetical protein
VPQDVTGKKKDGSAAGGRGAGLEVDFVLDGFFFPAGAGEHAAASFDHAGMTAEVGSGVSGREIPDFNVLSNQIVYAA